MTTSCLILHGTALSGHTHRVELFLNLLQLPYRRIDAPGPVRQSAEFLRLNPRGQIPVLQDGQLVLTDSNAILVYLAKRYAAGLAGYPMILSMRHGCRAASPLQPVRSPTARRRRGGPQGSAIPACHRA